MTLDVGPAEQEVIVHICGKLVLGDGVRHLRTSIDNLLKQGARIICVDCSQVSTVDAAGLGELASAYEKITRQGGRLRLLKTSVNFNNLLHLTGLSSMLL